MSGVRDSTVSRNLALGALALLTALNFLNYVDRYVLAAVLERIKGDPHFAGTSDARFGALQTAFFYSYMLLAPMGGALGGRVPRRYIISAGVLVWSAATVASGLARSYGELLLARALIGFGEAGYAAVAPALIADLFHPDRRNRVLSIFYLATPVGSALGFVLGGLVAASWGWRASFFVAGVPGMLLGLAVLLLPEPAREAKAGFLANLRSLTRNRAWLRVTAGGTLYSFAIGGLAFWMPSYFQVARGLDVARANLVVGGFAVGAGVLGTVAGSLLADAAVKRDRQAYVRVSGLSLLLGAPVALAVPFAPSLGLCMALLFIAETLAFVNTGPLNTALVESVPPAARETAVGVNIFFIHALGDAISPPLLGGIADVLHARGMAKGAALGMGIAVVAAPLLAGGLALLVGLARAPAGEEAPPAKGV